MSQKLSSAAVVIGALRVKCIFEPENPGKVSISLDSVVVINTNMLSLHEGFLTYAMKQIIFQCSLYVYFLPFIKNIIFLIFYIRTWTSLVSNNDPPSRSVDILFFPCVRLIVRPSV